MDNFVYNIKLSKLADCSLKSYQNFHSGNCCVTVLCCCGIGPLAHGVTVLVFQEPVITRKRLGLVHFF